MEKKTEIEINKRFSGINKNCVQLNQEISNKDVTTLKVVLNYLLNVGSKNKKADDEFNNLIKKLAKKYKNINLPHSEEDKYYATYKVIHGIYQYGQFLFNLETEEFKESFAQLFREYSDRVKEPKSFKDWPNDECENYEDDVLNKTK